MKVALDGRNYDEVPRPLLTGHILDIGAHNGANALLSRHTGLFLDANTEGRYHGIELDRSCALLKIEYADVTRLLLTRQYDCILMLHVPEHIRRGHWRHLLEMLKGALRQGGSLVIGVPYDEDPHTMHGHVEFHITPALLHGYLPGARYGVRRSDDPAEFRRNGRILPWWLKVPLRLLLGDARNVRRQLRGHYHLLAVWRKDGSRGYNRDMAPSSCESVAEANKRIMREIVAETHMLLRHDGSKRDRLVELLKILRSETAPIAGHSDPGAVVDCWNEVFEILEEARE